jgi:hypothetical protein
LRWSSGFVIGYSLIAAVVFVIAGPPDGRLSFSEILLLYVGLGAVAGVLIGLLRPFFQTRSGATVCGMIVGIAVYVGAGISVVGFRGLRDPGGMIGLLIAGIVIGGLSGSKWWKQEFLERDKTWTNEKLDSHQLLHGPIRFANRITMIARTREIRICERNPPVGLPAENVARRWFPI